MDARIRYSQKCIKEALIKILDEKPLEDVTVTEICRTADINRATFYKYYDSPVDLLEKMEEEHLEILSQNISDSNAMGIEDAFRLVTADIKANYALYKFLLSDKTNGMFKKRMYETCKEFNMKLIHRYFPQLSGEKKEWLFHIIAGGCIGLIDLWLEQDAKPSADEMASFAVRYINYINMHSDML